MNTLTVVGSGRRGQEIAKQVAGHLSLGKVKISGFHDRDSQCRPGAVGFGATNVSLTREERQLEFDHATGMDRGLLIVASKATDALIRRGKSRGTIGLFKRLDDLTTEPALLQFHESTPDHITFVVAEAPDYAHRDSAVRQGY